MREDDLSYDILSKMNIMNAISKLKKGINNVYSKDYMKENIQKIIKKVCLYYLCENDNTYKL